MMLCADEIDARDTNARGQETDPSGQDAGLREALRRGDPGAVEQLVERHGDRVYRLAMLATGDEADAADITREVLEAAAQSSRGLELDTALDAWIPRAAAGAVDRRLRGRRTSATRISGNAAAPPGDDERRGTALIDDWTKRTGAPIGSEELAGLMSEAVGALPAPDRIALVLHDVEGLSRADVAEILGTDAGAVSAAVHRARLRARARLSRHFAPGLAPESDEASESTGRDSSSEGTKGRT